MKYLARASIALAAAAFSACGAGPSTPTEPSGQTSGPASTTPIIVGIGGTPFATGEQTVTLHGQNFQAGLAVIVSFGVEERTEYSGPRVHVESDSLASVVATLTKAGQYTAQVRNPGGTLSNAFGFQVQTGSPPPPAQGPLPSPPPAPGPLPSPAPGPPPSPAPPPGAAPSIGAISPASPSTSPIDQGLAISGSGFEPGLTVTVFLPSGGSTTVGAGQIQNVSSTRFELTITLADPGLYRLRVTNPDGRLSNLFVFAVSASALNILFVLPQNPLVSAVDQRIFVGGFNFQPGLTVNVGLPGGGTSVISGNQIQNVSATQFEMLITLLNPGTYSLRAINPDGRQSNVFAFTALAAVLSITSLTPSNPVAGQTDQRIIVGGTNFQTGMMVTLGLPGGATITLSGSQIQNATSSRFEMLITLRDPGSYSLRVRNPDGRQSNVFSFTVR
jgi:hypothetical protein